MSDISKQIWIASQNNPKFSYLPKKRQATVDDVRDSQLLGKGQQFPNVHVRKLELDSVHELQQCDHDITGVFPQRYGDGLAERVVSKSLAQRITIGCHN